MRNDIIFVWVVAVLSAVISLMFGIVGANGDDVALFMHFVMIGISALFVVVGFIIGFIECYRGY